MKIFLVHSIFICIVISGTCQDFNYRPFCHKDHQILNYLEFCLAYNETHEQPCWVAYELTQEELLISRKRKNNFKVDNNINTGSASLEDYRGTGYDRGHLSRAMYNRSSEGAYSQSFLMSNMSPQLPEVNRGKKIWYELEEEEIKLAQKLGRVFCVSGPIFRENLGTIGKNEVTIPGYFYKAILSPQLNKAIAFLIKHEPSDKNVYDFAVTIDSLEAFAGIDFFPALVDSTENKIEADFDMEFWNYQPKTNTILQQSKNDELQCKGISKSTGEQCTRKPSKSSQFCWQH